MTYTRTFTHEIDCNGGEFCRTCVRCDHFGCQHRLDDGLNISPTDPEAKFRCLGPRLDGCEERCPDMARAGDGPR